MNACILLGVWGEQHIREFLDLSLYSLLAPGNIPAFTNRFETRFVFLTKSSSIGAFDSNPAYQKLKKYCKVEFIIIDDLIMSGNYSTTLTLAYDRAIKQTGAKMLETYFIFLTADYIMADGSLMGLTRYIDKGYSGICTGNYQVIEEEMKPYLISKIDKQEVAMTISPRELVKNTLAHLHPITIANFYNQKIIHNYYANRFFLYDSPETMAGRFYLLHMLCIKPETMDYQVGASCDYSFIPEMCPSGNVAVIDDSDDYLVIEIQPHNHELGFIQWGLGSQKQLVKQLAEWTTVRHRKNADTTIFYHANELDHKARVKIDIKLKQFIEDISQKLSKSEPMPYRDHPYWIGAFAALHKYKSAEKNSSPYGYIDAPDFDGVKRQSVKRLFGRQPNVFPWHYRWLNYRSMRKALTDCLAGRNPGNVLFLYDDYHISFRDYASWLKKLNYNEHFICNILSSESDRAYLKRQNIDHVICFISVAHAKNLPSHLALLENILAPGAKVTVIISNQNNHYPTALFDLKREMAYKINILNNSKFEIENIQTLHDNFTFYGSFTFKLINHIFKNQYLRFASYALVGVPASLICVTRNCLTYIFKHREGYCTDIFVKLTKV